MSIHNLPSQRKYFVDTILGVPSPKEDSIFVRVSAAEKELFKEAAEEEDQNLSDWLRKLAKKRASELGFDLPKEKGAKKKSS